MSGKQYLHELLSNLNAFAGIPQDRVTAIVEYVAELERSSPPMKPTPTQIDIALSKTPFIPNDGNRAWMAEALSASLSVPAEAVVGEPVAWRCKMGDQYWHYFTKEPRHKEPGEVWEPLYAAPSAPEGWQPIETAPKDETTIWVLDELYGKPWHYECNWNGIEWYHGFGVAWPDARPTHWRPLPAPPALGGSK